MSEISTIDQKLLRYASSKSPAEISELVGGTLSPKEVASRVMELLNERNWLTVLQRKQLLTDKLSDLLDRYYDWAMDGSVKSADVVFKAISEIRKLLAEDTDTLEEAMLKISMAHAERMGMAIAAGFGLLLERLKTPEDEAELILQEVMPIAMAKVDEGVEA